MNLKPNQLSAALEKPLDGLWTLHGNEPLLVLEAADAIRAAAKRQGYSERDTLVAGQGFRWSELMASAGNLSLFGAAKLLDLRIPNGKPGRDGGEALQQYAKHLPGGTVTLITLPELDWQTRKSAWFKALAEHGNIVELNAPDRQQLPVWIEQRLARQQQSLDAEGLRFIADHVEGNLLAAHQEILKLGLLYPAGPLTSEQVRAAVLNVARYDIDTLRQSLLEADPARCARLLEGLRGEGAAPSLILWAMATEIRTLCALRSGQDEGQPLAALLKRERVFDDRRRRGLTQAVGRLTGDGLRAALMHAARIDRIIKGLARGEVWDEFLLLALRLARTSSSSSRQACNHNTTNPLSVS